MGMAKNQIRRSNCKLNMPDINKGIVCDGDSQCHRGVHRAAPLLDGHPQRQSLSAIYHDEDHNGLHWLLFPLQWIMRLVAPSQSLGWIASGDSPSQDGLHLPSCAETCRRSFPTRCWTESNADRVSWETTQSMTEVEDYDFPRSRSTSNVSSQTCEKAVPTRSQWDIHETCFMS